MAYPALHSFYVFSSSFYTSYIVAESLIIFAGYNSFTNRYITFVVISDVFCFLLWLTLYFHVTQCEKNNRRMNDYRRAALKEKLSIARRQEEDR